MRFAVCELAPCRAWGGLEGGCHRWAVGLAQSDVSGGREKQWIHEVRGEGKRGIQRGAEILARTPGGGDGDWGRLEEKEM